LVSGNGWAAYPTTEGIVVTDKNGREFNISGDVFNPSDLKGDLAYEILTSAASVASDTDDQFLSMAVMGSKLYVAFRTQAVTANKVLTYDFSPGVEASGVEELLNPEKKAPYIWSPPFDYNFTAGNIEMMAMGSIVNASGRVDYVTILDNGGSTGDGRFDRINTGTTDNGETFFGYAVPAPWIPSDFKSLSPQVCEVKHLTTTGGASNLYFANNQTPTFNTTLVRTLPVVLGKVQFQKQLVPIDSGQRGKTDLFWAQWRAASDAVVATRLYQIVLQYDEVDNSPKYTGS
jgi:hypothetical protein